MLIGYKESEFILVDKEEIRFNDLWERYGNDMDYKRHNVALICLL